jgi:hypothetical protein
MHEVAKAIARDASSGLQIALVLHDIQMMPPKKAISEPLAFTRSATISIARSSATFSLAAVWPATENVTHPGAGGDEWESGRAFQAETTLRDRRTRTPSILMIVSSLKDPCFEAGARWFMGESQRILTLEFVRCGQRQNGQLVMLSETGVLELHPAR